MIDTNNGQQEKQSNVFLNQILEKKDTCTLKSVHVSHCTLCVQNALIFFDRHIYKYDKGYIKLTTNFIQLKKC